MNRFAEIKYGRINDIIETINDLDWVRTIFSPTSLWTDITDMLDSDGNRIEIGHVYEKGAFRSPATRTVPVTLEDHRRVALHRKDLLVTQKVEEGFFSKALGDEQFFPYNDEAKQMLDTDFELLEDDEEEGFVVLYRSTRDAEGSKNILKDDVNASQIKAIRKDFRKHKLACNKRGSEIAEQINQSTAIEEMYNYINWDK